MGFFTNGYAMTRRQVQDEVAYLITEAPEAMFFRAEHSGRFAELTRLLEQGRSLSAIPMMNDMRQSMFSLDKAFVRKFGAK